MLGWFGWLVFLFSGISTMVGFLLPNPVFKYILNIWFVNTFRITQINDLAVQFPKIQISLSHLFVLSLNVKQFYLTDR